MLFIYLFVYLLCVHERLYLIRCSVTSIISWLWLPPHSCSIDSTSANKCSLVVQLCHKMLPSVNRIIISTRLTGHYISDINYRHRRFILWNRVVLYVDNVWQWSGRCHIYRLNAPLVLIYDMLQLSFYLPVVAQLKYV